MLHFLDLLQQSVETFVSVQGKILVAISSKDNYDANIGHGLIETSTCRAISNTFTTACMFEIFLSCIKIKGSSNSCRIKTFITVVISMMNTAKF
jgi:hypothetical protein